MTVDFAEQTDVDDHAATVPQWARDYILGRETVQEKALHLAHAIVIHNDVRTADGEFDLFQNVTVADVQRVARVDDGVCVHAVRVDDLAGPGAVRVRRVAQPEQRRDIGDIGGDRDLPELVEGDLEGALRVERVVQRLAGRVERRG